jgi:hypothetical protein
MHERNQRAIARLMFVFCCALPTSLTVVCILVSWTPWYHQRSLRSIEEELSQDTGLIVQIEDFKRATPSTWHLIGVRVTDPETELEVAQVREVHWVSGSNEVSIWLHQPELQSSQLPKIWRLLHDRFLCQPERTDLPVKVAGNDLTIHSRTGALTLREIGAWIQPEDDSVEATIQGIPAFSRTNAPISINVRRDRSGPEPMTQLVLDTNGNRLPCSALAEYLPRLESLGNEATFFGTLQWQLDSDRWWVDMASSRLEQVSLDKLFEKQVHRLSGTATFQFDRCRIEPHNRRSDIVGSIHAADGMVGRSLLISAHQHLGFALPKIPTGLVDSTGDVPYDRLAIGFEINSTQLKLHGICRREVGFAGIPAGVILLLDGHPLVYSSDKTLDALSMITALAPSHSVPVPLSKQTSWLTSVLIPPSRPLPRDPADPPRIRFSDRSGGGPPVSQPR